MISKKLALEVLNAGLATGADYSEIYFQNNYSHRIILSKKKVDNVFGSLTYGVGIRLVKDTDVIYGYTSDLSRKSLLSLVQRLAVAIKGERKVEVKDFKVLPKVHKHDPIKPHKAMTTEEKIAYLKKGEEAAYAVDSQIVDVKCVLLEEDEDVVIYNSEGIIAKDQRVRTRVMVMPISSNGTAFESSSEGLGLSKGLELLEEFDYPAASVRAAERAVQLLTAPECPSGEMPVIIGNAFGGTLFHEACGHPLEGNAVAHNSSTFCGKMGQQIASPIVTAIDDGTIKSAWGSLGYDDEGNKATKNVLIKDGVLTNYMVDRVSGQRLGMDPTGSCRRESYRYVPTTRMTNTYIAPGKSTVDEIIAATEYGLYLQYFTGGSVDTSTDKFNFAGSPAYIIKNGKIDHMVKGAILVGYGYDVLMDIDMIANDIERSAGMCGASSGSCPVEVGQPTLRVKKMIVGGKGGQC